MTPISTRIIADRASLALSVCLAVSFFAALYTHATAARAQTSGSKAEKPFYHDYKGIQLGMSQDEVRKKLGSPKDKDDAQDLYLFAEEKEAAQIFYQAKKVFAVSVSYMGLKTEAPDAKAVLGADVAPAADGRVYKMVRYPEAGYWVSYSRIAGEEPIITVTMQKLQ